MKQGANEMIVFKDNEDLAISGDYLQDDGTIEHYTSQDMTERNLPDVTEKEIVAQLEYQQTPINRLEVPEHKLVNPMEVANQENTIEQRLLNPKGVAKSIPNERYAEVDLSDVPDDVKGFMRALGSTESQNNYFAKPNASGYEGKYQFRFRKGDDGAKYLGKLGISLEQWRKSPELQERMMATVVKDYDKQLRRAKLPVNNYTRWLRHNLGLGGAINVMSGGAKTGGASFRTLKRNILNQFGKKEKARLQNSSISTIIKAYNKKYKHRFI